MSENKTGNKSVFDTLNAIDLSDKIKEKNGFSYLPWAVAWSEVKKRYPEANYYIDKQIMDEYGNTRYWHDDGKSGWVDVTVEINGIVHSVNLSIMDNRNQALPAEKITSVDANKSLMRCLVKACALHGLSVHIFFGEDLPEEVSKLNDLQDELSELAKKKCGLSDKAKDKVINLCKAAEKETNPDMDDDSITGKISNINDTAILETLKKNLLAVRK